MIIALEIPRNIDLSLFSKYLLQSGIPHRVNEKGEFQVVWVRSEDEKEKLVELYHQYSQKQFTLTAAPKREYKSAYFRQFIMLLMRSPLTMIVIILNCVFFPSTFGIEEGHSSVWLQWLVYNPFEIMGDRIYFATIETVMQQQEYWRLFTPMFIHFGWLHIVFNLLWTWEVGRRIESVNGSLVLLVVILASSITANVMQHWIYGPSLFGGMSGVVYGLVGFALVWSQLVPAKTHGLQKGIYVVMLALLALGFSGLIDLLQLGNIANGAHLGGLLAGMVIAFGAFLYTRLGFFGTGSND